MPAREYVIVDKFIPILIPLSCHWTVRLIYIPLCIHFKDTVSENMIRLNEQSQEMMMTMTHRLVVLVRSVVEY